ncbi:MAG: DNA mismatch repair protein MutL [Tenericutes bacterium ADurb.Bin239]|nr:MAG: DNA mismatch repair protein MutL [Tenericutes bacterium ADurb.Bin239]
MGKIILLDNELANQIAAGEVIERPSSVVKELIENSIDAGATKIDIFIVEAGRKEIIVQDNGSGIDKDELPLAFARHATSKIYTTFDLFRIRTLGFRGEALPSIASIAKVKVETATREKGGVMATIEDGEIEIVPRAASVGTKITVTELFYNTPARLKYLKLDYTENAVTLDVVTKIALAHPDISFSLTFDDKLRFRTSGRGSLEETILNIYGLTYVKNLLPIKVKTNDFTIMGFLGNTNLVRSNRYGIITNLNGRNVYMPKVQSAIIEAYHGFIAPTRYPFVILNLEIEPELVDVNVHPTKKEVRFSKEEDLRNVLLKQIPLALRTEAFIPRDPHKKVEPIPSAIAEGTYAEQLIFDLPLGDDFKELPISDNDEKEIIKTPTIETITETDAFFVNPVAAIHNTYLICEVNDGGFWLVDQHAAHERINYEKFQRILNENLTTRPLLVPELLSFGHSEITLFTPEVFDILKDLGVEAELFGPNTIRVTAVPNWAGEYDERIYIQDIIDQVINDKRLNQELLRANAIATMACKASIKANHRLTILEMQHLIQELLMCDNPYSCPHGRPTIIKFTRYELERMFKRTGT